MMRILNLLATLLSVLGHAVAGTFYSNRLVIGAPERLPKSILIVGHMALWPFVGLLNARVAGREGFLRSILFPRTFGRKWALLFTMIGVRWLAQEVYRKRNPIPPPEELISTGVQRFDMRGEIIAHEGMTTSGIKGLLNKANEMYDLEIVTHELRLRNLPPAFEGFSLIQLSDLHNAAFSSAEFMRRYIDITLRLDPDLIALTGDYQTFPKDVEATAALLAPIGKWSQEKRNGRGVVAILGNHDREAGEDHVIYALRRAGIPVLLNEHITLEKREAGLCIAGVRDPWSGRADLDRALYGVPPGTSTILLAHVPDYLEQFAGDRVDLQLSGHNHGGQIKVPVIGALLVSSRFSRRYVEGFYKLKGTVMYVSRGIGGKPPIRLGSKPEITRFVLRSR